MFDVNEILARLQDGDSAEDLAAEMSKALNAAEAKFQEEKEQAAKAKVQEQKESDLNELAEIILDAIDEYISIKCPEAMDEEDIDMEVAEFRQLLDDLLDTMVKVKDLFALAPVKVPKAEPKVSAKQKSVDDKIADFLNKMGW